MILKFKQLRDEGQNVPLICPSCKKETELNGTYIEAPDPNPLTRVRTIARLVLTCKLCSHIVGVTSW